MDSTSADTLAAVGAGRDEAFARFYDAELAAAVRRVTLLTGSVSVAEDVVHTAMVEVYRRWDAIDRPAAYLHRCCINGSKRWQRRRERPAEGDLDDPTTTDDLLIEVLAELDVLTSRQRTAVVLRYLDGLTEAEIAEAMSCRPGTVGPLLSRARTTLREEWTP